ncbi:MAG TPA: DUF4240 domain-containing protein [Verrucomicrobiae bacterium]|nr:DUF4240 domain-containing protein [Verrucomicrobiae bacterium]
MSKNIDEFWTTVERALVASGGDMERKCELLTAELERLSGEKSKAFNQHLRDLFHRAYIWDLWGAAYLMNEGCRDDSLMDFRYTLISLGRTVCENALANPDSLALVNWTWGERIGGNAGSAAQPAFGR